MENSLYGYHRGDFSQEAALPRFTLLTLSLLGYDPTRITPSLG